MDVDITDKKQNHTVGNLTLLKFEILLCKISNSQTNKYFELKKLVGHQWGAPNSNYLLVMVSTFVMPFSMDPRMTPGCITQT